VRQSPALATNISGHISTDHQAKPRIIAPQSRRDQKRGPSQVLRSRLKRILCTREWKSTMPAGLPSRYCRPKLNPDSESKLIHVHEEPGPRSVYIALSRRADSSRNTGPV
jgi:hypothetical protein